MKLICVCCLSQMEEEKKKKKEEAAKKKQEQEVRHEVFLFLFFFFDHLNFFIHSSFLFPDGQTRQNENPSVWNVSQRNRQVFSVWWDGKSLIYFSFPIRSVFCFSVFVLLCLSFVSCPFFFLYYLLIPSFFCSYFFIFSVFVAQISKLDLTLKLTKFPLALN